MLQLRLLAIRRERNLSAALDERAEYIADAAKRISPFASESFPFRLFRPGRDKLERLDRCPARNNAEAYCRAPDGRSVSSASCWLQILHAVHQLRLPRQKWSPKALLAPRWLPISAPSPRREPSSLRRRLA